MVSNLQAVRDAIEQGKTLAAEFTTGTASFYEDGNTTPVFTTPCRVKKPRPSAFDAGGQTEWSTKRTMVVKVPMTATSGIIRKGLIVQISTPDGDPTINLINFVVQSSLGSQFSAEREVLVTTEVNATPRVT